MSKWMLVLICSFLIAAEWPAHAQSVPMQQAGMEPLTDTIIIHDFPGIPPARKVENIAVQILEDRRIVVAWEDDLSQIGSGWVMLTPEGKLITKGIRSFQKQDGSYSSLMGMFAPKLKANLFGPGFLFAATYYDWHGKDAPQNTIPDFLELSENDDAPVLQRVQNDGEFSGSFVVGFPLEFMKRPGPLRLADIDMLSDGNYAVLTQSYQQGDGTFFKRPHAETVVLVTIVSPQGNVLHGPVCVQQEDRTAEAWHGLAVGEGCFGVKYVSGYTQIRFFRNNLIPLTDAIVIDPTHHLQDRGDASGWHGNGKDRFLQVSPTGINTSAKGAYANVFNAQGERLIETCHFAPADEIIYGGCDGAIDPEGNFICVFEVIPQSIWDAKVVIRSALVAQAFNTQGKPVTPFFQVSSIPYDDCVSRDVHPRIALRHNLAAVAWQDRNTNLCETDQLGLRVFRVKF